MQTPPRSLEQRLAALDKGNKVRSRRAVLKRDLKAGRVTAVALLDGDAFATAKVYDLLVAIPKIGRVKALEILRRTAISPAKTCGGLTDRQRDELRTQLNHMAYRRQEKKR